MTISRPVSDLPRRPRTPIATAKGKVALRHRGCAHNGTATGDSGLNPGVLPPAADGEKIHKASADLINAFAKLDVARMWGDGHAAATDGSQLDTWEDNLLAESHIRYGGFGAIAFRLVSDNYIALFSRFIPCGVWEAVYILDSLLRNDSDVQPGQIHADTQGQSLPVFGLAALLGFELLPRIRNRHDLSFYRPDAETAYEHIDTLFGDNVIDWGLIEKHWPDLLRAGISIREGPPVLGDTAAPPGQPLPAQPAVQGAARARPRHPHDHAAAVLVRAGTPRPDRRRHQQDGAVPQLLPVPHDRRAAHRPQRPGLPGAGGEVQRAGRQRCDLLHRPGHHRRRQRPGRRGLPGGHRRPGHRLPVHHAHDTALGRRPHPARSRPGHPPGPGTACPVPGLTPEGSPTMQDACEALAADGPAWPLGQPAVRSWRGCRVLRAGRLGAAAGAGTWFTGAGSGCGRGVASYPAAGPATLRVRLLSSGTRDCVEPVQERPLRPTEDLRRIPGRG